MPKIVSASEAKNRLGAVLSWVLDNQDDVIIESRGAPAVVVIPYSEYEKVQNLKEQERRKQALQRLRNLRSEVTARNQGLTPEQADALADRFSRDLVDDLVQEGKVKFEE